MLMCIKYTLYTDTLTENDEPSGKATYRLRRDNNFAAVDPFSLEFRVEFVIETLPKAFDSLRSMLWTLCTTTNTAIKMNDILLMFKIRSIIDLHPRHSNN